MTPLRFLLHAGSALALTALGIHHSSAALLVYEGFMYPAGESLTNVSAQGPSGSFGWGGRWTGANNPVLATIS